jgi:hypothetical protein
LAIARNEIARLFGDEIERITNTRIQYLTAAAIYDRYAELLANRPRRALDSALPPLFQARAMITQACAA